MHCGNMESPFLNQDLGGSNPGLNFVETGVADGRLFLQAGGNVGTEGSRPRRRLKTRGRKVFGCLAWSV